ncbi:MAG: helix-turn-helix transcriptional regulator [Candidatus Micrarchaeia archaeon]|jgi:DNA-binding PadR family transcriptional regulator
MANVVCGHKQSFRGLLELFILGECNRGPCSGRAVMDAVARLTEGKWKPSPGAVYPVLSKLERNGFVKPVLSGGRGRREIMYETTAKGKKALVGAKADFGNGLARMIAIAWPVMARVMHEMDEEEIAFMSAHFNRINKAATVLLSLPRKKRREALERLSEKIGETLAEKTR